MLLLLLLGSNFVEYRLSILVRIVIFSHHQGRASDFICLQLVVLSLRLVVFHID